MMDHIDALILSNWYREISYWGNTFRILVDQNLLGIERRKGLTNLYPKKDIMRFDHMI